MGHAITTELTPLNIAVLTITDTRDKSTDTSGQLLIDKLTTEGHRLADRHLIDNDLFMIRAMVSAWIVDKDIHAVLINGGTGINPKDCTTEAVSPLLEITIDGFGELFRQVSFTDIGTSTMQSRAMAGLANGTFIACLPGSTSACETAWENLLQPQLDSRHSPCNLVHHLSVCAESHCICK